MKIITLLLLVGSALLTLSLLTILIFYKKYYVIYPSENRISLESFKEMIIISPTKNINKIIKDESEYLSTCSYNQNCSFTRVDAYITLLNYTGLPLSEEELAALESLGCDKTCDYSEMLSLVHARLVVGLQDDETRQQLIHLLENTSELSFSYQLIGVLELYCSERFDTIDDVKDRCVGEEAVSKLRKLCENVWLDSYENLCEVIRYIGLKKWCKTFNLDEFSVIKEYVRAPKYRLKILFDPRQRICYELFNKVL